jgi:hypothetical protein
MEGNAGRSRRLRRLGWRGSTYGLQQGFGRGAVWSKAARGSAGQRLGELRRPEAVPGSSLGSNAQGGSARQRLGGIELL